MLQLVRGDRTMVRGEIYRYGGLGESYRAGGIARTIVKKLNEIKSRSGELVDGLKKFLPKVPGVPKDPQMVELVTAFATISKKGQEVVARWVKEPDKSVADAEQKLKAVLGMVQGYERALREWRPVPPPPSSPIDQFERPQLTPRFERLEAPLTGSLIPTGANDGAGALPAPATPEKSAEPAAPEAPAAANPESAAAAAEAPPPVTLILPRGVNPEILEDVKRVDQCRKVFEETHQQIEVWEVFCLVMIDAQATKESMEWLLHLKQKGDKVAFQEGALQLFERLLKLRARYGKFVKDLRGFLATLPVGTFGKDTMEMALGFIVASDRGRNRAQMWIQEPSRYKMEAAGRLEDIISRVMNYQTALRMLESEG